MGSLSPITPETRMICGREFLVCPRCGGGALTLWEGRCCADCAAAEPPPRSVVLELAGVPERYRQPFDAERSPEIAAAVASFRDWKGDPALIRLAGGNGTGKSMLAAELLVRWYAATVRRHSPADPWPVRARWVSCRDLVNRILGPEDRESRAAGWAALCVVPLLVVDDLGRGHEGGAWGVVADVLAARYDAMHPTVVTSNLRLAPSDPAVPVGKRPLTLVDLDPSIADRLRDGVNVALDGRSLRGGSR